MKVTDSNNKARLGAIGEHLVATHLLANGWDAILANMSISNVAKYDIVCINPKTGDKQLVQVKTSIESNIPIGITLEESVTEVLQSKIIGPWVFVYVEGKGEDKTFRFFVLSRSEMIRLTNDSNDWYLHKWKSSYRKKPVSVKNPNALKVTWLYGMGEEDNAKHYEFINPLTESSEDKWNKIWDE